MINPNFTSRYSHKWNINFLQCYPNGVIKYTDLCHIFQLTAGIHADLGGLSYTAMQKHHQAWVLTKMRIEIEKLPRWRDEVEVKTWIVEMNGGKSVRAIALFLDHKMIASALTEWVVMDTQTRKSTLLSLDFDHFELFPDDNPIMGKIQKIEIPKERVLLDQYLTKISDLDIVGHVNNVKYLEWCLDRISGNLILAQKIKSFDLNFIRELHLQDEVSIEQFQNDDILSMSIFKNKKISFATEITLKSE
jgi:medium-chain acyl-[acyl-carrier-protein] hydrolase